MERNSRVRSFPLSWGIVAVAALALLLLLMAGAEGSSAMPAARLPASPSLDPLQPSRVVTIGLAVDLSGPVEQIGWQEANAVQLAISETNAAGGLNIGGITYTVVMVTADDQCDPAQAPAAAQALLDAGAVAVVGHTCSEASNAAQPLYYAAGVAMVSPSSTWPDLTAQGYTTTLRVVAHDNAGPIHLAGYVYQELGITRTAMVERDGVPLYIGEAFSTTFSGLGGTITSRRSVTGTAAYTATLGAIKHEDHPGAILYVDPDAGAAGFFSHVSDDGVGMDDVPIAWAPVGEDYSGLGAYVAAAGPAAADDYAGFPQRRADEMPGYDSFNKAYVTAGFPHYGDEAGMMGAFAYDDARIVLAAIERAGSTDPAAIRDAIAATPPYAGVVGNYAGFDALGDVIPQWAWIYPFAGPWQPLGGPAFTGGQGMALAVDPTVSGTLYAALQVPETAWEAGSSLYRSSDGGATWALLYTPAESVRGLVTNGTIVYAGAYNRDEWNPHPLLYRSSDGGQSWEGTLAITNGVLWALAVHPTLTATAVAGGGDYPDRAMLLRTADAGVTWEEVFSYTMPGWYPTVNAVTILPPTPTVWLLVHDGQVGGDAGSFICRSTDSGDSWTTVYTISQDTVDQLVTDPTTPTTIYASTAEHNLLRSGDGGLTWAAVITDGSAGRRLVVDAPHTLYATRGGEVRVSSDGGDTWGTAGYIPDGVRALAIDRGPAPGALYAGLDSLGVFRSADGGQTWADRNTGISTLVWPRDIDVAPGSPERLFVAARSGGGWRSDDGGVSWQSLPLPWMASFAITPQDPAVVFGGVYNCGGASIFRSADGGLSFAPAFTPTQAISDCSGGDEGIEALDVAPALSTTAYAAGWDHPDWGPAQALVVRSLDGGLSWTVAFTRPAESDFQAVAIDPADPDRVYAGGWECSGGPCSGVVYRTTDGGENWTLVLTTTGSVRSIVMDRQKSYVVYVGSNDYSLYKSKDGGDSWTTIRTCCPSGNLLAIDPYVPSHVYLGGWGYVAESQDGGEKFTEGDNPFGLGVPPMEPRSLAVDSEAEMQTFYAGFSGVWTRTRAVPQPGEAAEIQMWTDPPSATAYANGLDGLFYHGLGLDIHGNWVADGTAVTVTYDLHELGQDGWTVVKFTSNGHVQGGVFSSAAGTVTFTAAVNIRATNWVTGTFLYNPPAGITITGAPVSLTVGGATGIVTATLPGVHDGVASDGTVVTWETSLGTIVTATLTTAGTATTTLTSGSLAGAAAITATAGEFDDTITVEFVGQGYRIYLPLVLR